MTAEKRTYTIEWESYDATFTVDAVTGAILSREIVGEPFDDLPNVTRFDVAEYQEWWRSRHPESLECSAIHILDIGFWYTDSTGVEAYDEPESTFRYDFILMEIEDMDDLKTQGSSLDDYDHAYNLLRNIVGVDLETTRNDYHNHVVEISHDLTEITHFSIYGRVPNPSTGVEEARHLIDIYGFRGGAAALEIAQRVAALLDVPLSDNRRVLLD